MTTVRTRFAPSPSGQVHIGNIRVAIYNWLYARKTGGKFLLRVEDTDQERSTAEAVQAVHSAMDWLGLDVDEEPVFQSTRRDAHLAAAQKLLDDGRAYKEDKGGTGQGECVIFKMADHDQKFSDLVKGDLAKSAEHMADFVIVRSDGSPVFHLANVVDDIHMGITHVIRGDDHVENTFRHLALIDALGGTIPEYAHLPMIVNRNGKPYSKRDGDAYVGDFRDQGFLSDALFNYLVLLGWASGDDQEIYTPAALVEAFSLDRVQSSAAQFDTKKLTAINAAHLHQMDPEKFAAVCREEFAAAGIDVTSFQHDEISEALALIQPRVRLASDARNIGHMLFSVDYPVDDKALNKRLRTEEAHLVLADLKNGIADKESLTAEDANSILQGIMESRELGPGKVNPVIRVTLTGQMGGPELVDLMAWLGPAKIASRIARIENMISDGGAG